jgi:hypothetical protein
MLAKVRIAEGIEMQPLAGQEADMKALLEETAAHLDRLLIATAMPSNSEMFWSNGVQSSSRAGPVISFGTSTTTVS